MAETQKTMNIQAGNASASVTAKVADSMPGVPCPTTPGYTYTGMRYVPVFADPPEWSDQNTYEPLTIVTYQGSSYTSKTFVPVGASIDNPDFWVLTGNYNAQVEQYRQEVEKIGAQVNHMELSKYVDMSGKTVMIFGDSNWSPTSTGSIGDYMEQFSGCTVINKAVSGSFIYDGDTSMYNILSKMTATDFVGVDYVIMGYCTNDWQGARSILPVTYGVLSFKQQIKECINALMDKAPLATPLMVTPAYGHRPFVVNSYTQINRNGRGLDLEAYVNAALDVCYKLGVSCIDLYHTMGINESNYKSNFDVNPGTDIYVHYNNALKQKIAILLCMNRLAGTASSPYQIVSGNKLGVSHFPLSNRGFTKEVDIFKNAVNYEYINQAPIVKFSVGEIETSVLFRFIPGIKYTLCGFTYNTNNMAISIGSKMLSAFNSSTPFHITFTVDSITEAPIKIVNNSKTTGYIVNMQLFEGVGECLYSRLPDCAIENTMGLFFTGENLPGNYAAGSFISAYSSGDTKHINLSLTATDTISPGIILSLPAEYGNYQLMVVMGYIQRGGDFIPCIFDVDRNGSMAIRTPLQSGDVVLANSTYSMVANYGGTPNA